MSAELVKVEAEILHLAVRTAGLLCKRAVLVGDVPGIAAHTARLNKLIAQRQDFELQQAEQRGECFFAAAGELAGQALEEAGRCSQ